MHVRCRDGFVECLYEDGCPVINSLVANADSVQVVRNSHIEPMPSGVEFKIVWEPWVQPYVRESVTTVDVDGLPFKTKFAAERYERDRLNKYYFV